MNATYPTVDITAAYSTVSDTTRERREDRAAENDRDVCVCCSHGIKGGDEQLYIMCVEGTTAIVADGREEEYWMTTDAFMGSFPVGPTCAKKIQKAGVPIEWFTSF